MKLIMLILMAYASTLAAGPRTTTEPKPMDELRSRPKPAARGKRTFHPFGLLRRVGKAERELAFHLSSWGIRPDAEASRSHALPLQIPSAETSNLMLRGPVGGASQ
jgi:hypothetical protein